MRKKVLVFFVCAVLFLYPPSLSGHGSSEDLLSKHIEFLGPVENANLYQVCGFLSSKGIPIGIEETVGYDRAKYKRIVQVKSGTLREILESLTKQENDYTWEFRNGSVNIYPIRSRDDVLKDLLETSVPRFRVEKGEERVNISKRIKSLNTVQYFLNSRELVLGISTLPDLVLEKTTEVTVGETNLRELLNEIVKTRPESKRWLIQRAENGEIHLLF